MLALDGGAGPGGAGHPDILTLLGDRASLARRPGVRIEQAADAGTLAAYRELRRAVFVAEQGLFDGSDADDRDDDPRTVVLVARDTDGTVLGGVRLGPVGDGPDLGWWYGGRLVVAPYARGRRDVGPALIRAACARAEAEGVLRFEATVQARVEPLFVRLGWRRVRTTTVAGAPHVLMRWPIGRIAAQAAATKSPLGPLLSLLTGVDPANPSENPGTLGASPAALGGDPAAAGSGPLGGTGAPGRGVAVHGGLRGSPGGYPGAAGGLWGTLGGAGFVGDDGAPVPGTDLVAACDAIVPSMVERDPEWAGWCSVLVNLNDLAAMGAASIGLLDALAALDAAHAARVLSGLRDAVAAFGSGPVLGGHTQLGVPPALAVTALGRTAHPVPGGGGRPGHRLRLTADLGGRWRPGYQGRQWDSTSHRRTEDLRAMLGAVAEARPAAAKDVSMAGIAGTAGMLAEASGCRAVLDVADVPRPSGTTTGDWLTCFPGFAMLTADGPDAPAPPAGPAASAVCGELTTGRGVALRWPDGEVTDVVTEPVTGLGNV